VKYALCIPDTHVDSHDERAYQLMLTVSKDLPHLDEICILGDFADMLSVTSHKKDAAYAAEILQDEINAVKKKIKELNKLFPHTNKVYIEGNHENRLSRYISEKCPELFGVFSFPELIGISKDPYWKWVPYGPYQAHKVLNSKLIARHTPLGGGVHHAKATAIKGMCSIIYGHVHQIQESQVVALDGKNYRAFCPGWLGDYKKDAFSYVQNHAQWSLGFCIVSVLPNRNWFANTCHIIDYQTTYGSKVYNG